MQETAENKALINTNAMLTQELSQAEKALSQSKALAVQNANQAALDVENGKKSCSLVQKNLDIWSQFQEKAMQSPAQGASVAQSVLGSSASSIDQFNKEGTALRCPGKPGALCAGFTAVEGEFKASRQFVIDTINRTANLASLGGVRTSQAELIKRQQIARGEAAEDATKNIVEKIGELSSALGC